MIINCKLIADKIINETKKDIFKLKNIGINPHLAIIKANDSISSDLYIKNKYKKGMELGVDISIYKDLKSEKDILQMIEKLNQNDLIHGIIIQLPLYKEIKTENVLKMISFKKDIEGFSYRSVAKLWNGSSDFCCYPCTAMGIIRMFEYCNYNLEGKKIVIINRSNIVGKPLAGLFLRKNATVTLCHSKTKDIHFYTKNADVIVVGVGIKNFLTQEMVNENTFVVDVGINIDENKKICGDADFRNLKDYVGYITPVPNGVGQLTIAMVYRNLIDLILKNKGLTFK